MVKDMTDMTEELERSRAFMDRQLADMDLREEKLQETIKNSVKQALEEYIKNNPPADPKSDPIPEPTPTPSARVTDTPDPSHDSNSAIQLIRGSSNLLARLMSKVELGYGSDHPPQAKPQLSS